MKSDSGGALGGRGKAWVRSSLVLVQVSLSFVLLIAAGLLLKSVRAMQDANPGFSADQTLTTSVDMIAAGYDTERIKSFEDQLLDRVQGMAGIESAAFARVNPISYKSYSSARIAIEGYERQKEEQPVIEYAEVGPAFLTTLGIPLISGREFTRADNETVRFVAVVNQTMVWRFWGGQDPAGKRLQVKGQWFQVVGVAQDSNTPASWKLPSHSSTFRCAKALWGRVWKSGLHCRRRHGAHFDARGESVGCKPRAG